MTRKPLSSSPRLLALVAQFRDRQVHPMNPSLRTRRIPTLLRRTSPDGVRSVFVAGSGRHLLSSRSMAELDELVQLWYRSKRRAWSDLRPG